MLPPVIEQLVSIVGVEAVHALVEAHLLGFRQRIGRTRNCEWWGDWADVIGDGPTDAVMAVWAGQAIYFPACKDAIRNERNRAIIAAYEALLAEGVSTRRAVRQLCRRHRLSDRQIEKIVGRVAPESPEPERAMARQLGLF